MAGLVRYRPRCGDTGEPAIFEMERGFCQLFGGSDGSVILEDLGTDWISSPIWP